MSGDIVAAYGCPACGVKAGEPCRVPIQGTDTSGWSHDVRILAPILADLGRRTADEVRDA